MNNETASTQVYVLNLFIFFQINRNPSIIQLISSLRTNRNAVQESSDNGQVSENVTKIPQYDEIAENVNTDNELNSNEIFEVFEEVEEEMSYDEQNFDSEDMRKLHPNTDCTVIDAICMTYTFAMRHNLTWNAVEDLLNLLNRIIGREELAASKHMFKKKVRNISNFNTTKHFVCQKCDLYLGTANNIKTSSAFCPNCKSKIQTDTKYKKNHFITIPLRSHLQDMLERNKKHLNIDFHAPVRDIYDVHDSYYFQRMREKMGEEPFITLTFSTDGAAIFKSTKEKSVWPIQFIVNEIDLMHRFKRENVFCSAIAFGKTPNMQVFFKPFIDEINEINADGGLSITLKNGHTQKLKIFPMIFTGDTPARADVLKKTFFNGYNGCSYCLHRGTLVNKQIRYCKRDNGPLRSDQDVRNDMIEAQKTSLKVNGYKGVSPLMALDYFDVVWQVGIDKMHNIDLGVISLLFNIFLDPKNRKQRYNVHAAFTMLAFPQYTYFQF